MAVLLKDLVPVSGTPTKEQIPRIGNKIMLRKPVSARRCANALLGEVL